MEATNLEDCKGKYKTSHRVQAWFLGRSRERWKNKYMQLKVEAKRLKNRVADVTKSRENWREQNEQLTKRVQELEAQNAVLQEQAPALKKYGSASGGGVG
jgi:chromosome segregation ATPase